MSLLDWLGDALGGRSAGVPGASYDQMGQPTGIPMEPPPAPPQAPPPMPAPNMGMNAPVGPQEAGPVPLPMPRPDEAPMAGPVPMPMARPDGAPQDIGVRATKSSMAPPLPPPTNVGGGPGSGLPVNAEPTEGRLDVTRSVRGYQDAGGRFEEAKPQAKTMIGRAFGLDPTEERRISGALAAGLKAVPGNSNKPGLAAFAGSLGSGMEGGDKAGDKHVAEQQKYLEQMIKAQQTGDTGALNIARIKLLQAQTKATREGKAGGKDSVMNTREQLYLRGLGAVNQDQKVKASAASLRELQKPDSGAKPEQIAAAKKAHDDLINEVRGSVFGNLGITEKDAGEIGKKAGFSTDNPVPAAGLNKQNFDKLPDGAYFINPADGRLLQKRSQAPATGGNTPTPAAMSPTPAIPSAPAPSSSSDDDDD